MKSMAEDPKHILPDGGENTEEERQAQFKKDREAFEQRNKETELLMK